MRPLNIIAALGLILALGLSWSYFRSAPTLSSAGFEILTTQVQQRDLSRLVASSGSIAPLVTVEVGSQLSGQILSLSVDFNDDVEEGSILAQLDPQTFQTRVQEAEANLEVAQAQVAVQRANVTRAQANLASAERAFNRAVELRERGTYSEAQYDTAETAFQTGRADVDVAEANLRNAQASLRQREAALESANVDLGRTFIRSPINGVVIDRQIDVGSTVAASLNAPVLFVLAQDLGRIQIEAQIDEADIGQIRPNQPVTFDVDAYPDQEFSGAVTQVRLAAQNEQNVVTYTVVIEANNPGQRLLPGMTANVSIVTGQSEGVLSVPNSALRYNPRGGAESLVVESANTNQQAGPGRGPGGGGPGGGRMAEINEALNLTEDQQSEVQSAMREAFSQMQRQMQSGGPRGARPDVQAIMRRAYARVLNSEQMSQLNDLLEASTQQVRRGQVWVQAGNGQIRAVPVVLGLSDGQYTEIRTNQLQAGDEIITQIRETN